MNTILVEIDVNDIDNIFNSSIDKMLIDGCREENISKVSHALEYGAKNYKDALMICRNEIIKGMIYSRIKKYRFS